MGLGRISVRGRRRVPSPAASSMACTATIVVGCMLSDQERARCSGREGTMKTILLTGAAGFIGSNTASALLDRGDVVIGVDNLNDYYDPARKQSNLEEVRAGAPDPSNFVFYESDIRDEAAMEAIFAEHEPESIIHLAAMAGVRASMDDPRLYFDVKPFHGDAANHNTRRRIETAPPKSSRAKACWNSSAVR